jgi:hypothetical protein
MENQRTRFIVRTEVNRVEKINNLWYVNFLGSWESLAFGEDKPWEVGAKIKITFEEDTDEYDIQNRQAPAQSASFSSSYPSDSQ